MGQKIRCICPPTALHDALVGTVVARVGTEFVMVSDNGETTSAVRFPFSL